MMPCVQPCRQVVELARHVYDMEQFLTFLKTIDTASSKMGICNR